MDGLKYFAANNRQLHQEQNIVKMFSHDKSKKQMQQNYKQQRRNNSRCKHKIERRKRNETYKYLEIEETDGVKP